MMPKPTEHTDSDDLVIIYLMARSDGLSKEEAQEAVALHCDTGCGYNWKRREE